MNTNNVPDIATPTRTRAIMETYGLTFKKSLGQNFLTDVNVLHKIVDAGQVSNDDDVIEIGPGIGALTEQLARNAHQVLALELDTRLIPVLAETLSPYENVKILNRDILKTDLKKIIKENFDGAHNVKVVANLPYYITTPIIMHLLEADVKIESIVVMMQKEVAQRLAAKPGTKDYGALTVAVQFDTNAKIAFIVPKTVFMPQPKVDSAIVVLENKVEHDFYANNREQFNRLVKGCFSHRRKSLWNNLQSLYGKEVETKNKMTSVLQKLDIEQSIRAEKLSIQQLVELSNALLAEKLIIK